MSAVRIIPLAAAFGTLATAAPAQTPRAEAPATVLEFGMVQPVMDNPILAHVIFSQLEGRWNGTNTEFRWEGQGRVGTDYDKLWIKSEATAKQAASSMTASTNSSTTEPSRPTSTWRAGCAALSIRVPPAIGPLSASRVWRLTSSTSSSPVMSAAKAASPPSSKPHTTF